MTTIRVWLVCIVSLCVMAGSATEFGSVKVTIEPAGARSAGAKWKINSVEASSLEVKQVPTGEAELRFTEADGYITPFTRTIVVSKDKLTELNVGYATAPSALANAIDGLKEVQSTSAVPWTRVVDPYGDYAKSGTIGPNATTSMKISMPGAGQLRYNIKISSEPNYDILRLWFYPPNGEAPWKVGETSGSAELNCLWHVPSAGELKFEYTKDFSISLGDDCAIVDNVQWQPLFPFQRADFNGDGRDDFILRHGPTKTGYVCNTNTDCVSRTVRWSGGLGPEWIVAGTGRFDSKASDSADDMDIILLHQPTGYAYYCLMQDGGASWNVAKTEFWGDTWELLGTPNINGDRHSDIILRNKTTGEVQFARLNTYDLGRWPIFTANWNQSWKLLGTGDFNADGFEDVILKYLPNGTVYFCRTKPDLTGWTVSHAENWGNEWALVAVGKLNDDNRADLILKQNSTGQVIFSTFNPDGINRTTRYTSTWGNSWTLEAIGDLNGDMRSDLILRYVPTGTVYYCEMKPVGAGWNVTHTENWGPAWTLSAPK